MEGVTGDSSGGLAIAVERLAHPLFLAGALGIWWVMGQSELAVLAALAIALMAMEVLERLVPAMPAWRQTRSEKVKLVGVYVMVLTVSVVITGLYDAIVWTAFADFRESTGSMIWPQSVPLVIQVFMLYFASEFIYYWIHRGIHNWSVLWRLSGHGFHHAFHNLHAINVASTHPFEVLFLTLPMVLLAAIFGAPQEAVAGALVLLVVNGTLAHANLRMNTPVLNWFVTSSDQHRRHHSQEFAVSNTNYSCNAIIWDRLFGTYSRGAVKQTGIGPRQPALWEMFLLPFREPTDADTVSTRSRPGR